jgi:hypothetical protein
MTDFGEHSGIEVPRPDMSGSQLDRGNGEDAGTGTDVGGSDSGDDSTFQKRQHNLRALVIPGAKRGPGIDIQRHPTFGFVPFVPGSQNDEPFSHCKRREGFLPVGMPLFVLYFPHIGDPDFRPRGQRPAKAFEPKTQILGAAKVCPQEDGSFSGSLL